MRRSFHRLMAIVSLSMIISTAVAQPAINSSDISFKKESKPFKILTDGKRVTVKSTKDIKTIMVWTATGHRIVHDLMQRHRRLRGIRQRAREHDIAALGKAAKRGG